MSRLLAQGARRQLGNLGPIRRLALIAAGRGGSASSSISSSVEPGCRARGRRKRARDGLESGGCRVRRGRPCLRGRHGFRRPCPGAAAAGTSGSAARGPSRPGPGRRRRAPPRVRAGCAPARASATLAPVGAPLSVALAPLPPRSVRSRRAQNGRCAQNGRGAPRPRSERSGRSPPLGPRSGRSPARRSPRFRAPRRRPRRAPAPRSGPRSPRPPAVPCRLAAPRSSGLDRLAPLAALASRRGHAGRAARGGPPSAPTRRVPILREARPSPLRRLDPRATALRPKEGMAGAGPAGRRGGRASRSTRAAPRRLAGASPGRPRRPSPSPGRRRGRGGLLRFARTSSSSVRTGAGEAVAVLLPRERCPRLRPVRP